MSPFAVITFVWVLGWAAAASVTAYAINHSGDLKSWQRERLQNGFPAILVALLVIWPGTLVTAAKGAVDGAAEKWREYQRNDRSDSAT